VRMLFLAVMEIPVGQCARGRAGKRDPYRSFTSKRHAPIAICRCEPKACSPG